ncbi:hypothetical protein [Oceanobacillus halotolerans]|uniref:hypothetical protein n=1 Tax=Oceanobacillus halotolerans TaxID=2663380 RepID=UPI0013DCAF3A|nr:hypothetical protein [Oceanobacillus halotolerans]
MNRRTVIYTTTTVGVGTLAWLFAKKQKQMREIHNQAQHTLLDAGIPDQIPVEDEAQMENAKMVSEGSQYGVHYYNKTTSYNK